jgi:hypothetical protein
MERARIVAEAGSFRLIAQGDRYAVVEARDGMVYGLRPEGQRPSAEDGPDGMGTVVAPGDWTDEATARALFRDLVATGERLARRLL